VRVRVRVRVGVGVRVEIIDVVERPLVRRRAGANGMSTAMGSTVCGAE
jgi:hypothetical protein